MNPSQHSHGAHPPIGLARALGSGAALAVEADTGARTPPHGDALKDQQVSPQTPTARLHPMQACVDTVSASKPLKAQVEQGKLNLDDQKTTLAHAGHSSCR